MQLEQIGRKDIIEQVGKVDGKATTTDAAQSEQKIAKGKIAQYLGAITLFTIKMI